MLLMREVENTEVERIMKQVVFNLPVEMPLKERELIAV
jgi:hypothetical protein|uniref:Uncharacterized protein n=1 Tax=Siphoviridae sp. ctDcW16 TaxID=2826199 RepID=A0A8S5MU28_9CAUD|nr:MAG TPA: hypothetical protein [Siphoviridae sp. ctDcW16]DAF23940.1 MAG TPA: hypothetical protein [Caudoviricetes sp.]